MKKLLVLLITALLLSFGVTAEAFDMQLREDSSQRFVDVSEKDAFKTAIDVVLTYGIMNGVAEDRFEPLGSTTRGALVTTLWRMSGSPHIEADTPFNDLTQDWYAESVKWAYSTGIVNGTSPDTFSPDLSVSREVLGTVFFRFLTSLDKTASPLPLSKKISDKDDISPWAVDSMGWASELGIMDITNGKLRPKDSATRAEIATVIMNFCGKYQILFPTDDISEEDKEYVNVIKKLASSYKYSYLGEKDANSMICLRHPAEWTFIKRADGGFDLMRDGKLIGEAVFGKADNGWKVVSSRTNDGQLRVTEHIEKHGGGITLSFRYRYEYAFTEGDEEKVITLILDLSHVSTVCAKRLFKEPVLQASKTAENYGILSSLKGKKILIAGNSFVGTSKIGYTLSDLIEGSGENLSVYHWSTGYAHIDTYLNSSEFMGYVRNGTYDAIFICGLYSTEQIEHLGTLKKECDRSGTQLIVLPAHNEHQPTVKEARDKFPELVFIDWKAEITALIDSGISKWDMCINDAHLHSTPLAGYVGAHMIYRAIFGECPTAYPSRYLTKPEVEKLGKYHTDPIIEIVDKSEILELN